MTAPTSPGVVPADVRELVERLRDPMWSHAAGREPILDEEDTLADMSAAADMLERLANRPSLTEDERGQVRREALEEAAQRADAYWNSNTVPPYYGACPVAARIRALADRSEPRQEKEDGRG